MKAVEIKIGIVMLLIFAQFGHTQWTNELSENTIVSYFIIWPTLVPDEDNGAIVFGYSREIFPKVYAQRISVDGYIMWLGPLGIRVSEAFHEQRHTHGSENKRFAMADGAGGAFIGFRVWRIIGEWPEVGELYDVRAYLQRLDALGNRLFGADGLWLLPGSKDSSQFSQEIKNWSPDGHGGLYVVVMCSPTLEETREGIYLSRISLNGQVIWGPIKLTGRYRDDYIPYLDRDFNLNLYLYPGETVPPGLLKDMFLKIDANSGEIISERPIEIGVGEYGFSCFCDYCQSNDGSAIIAFSDFDRANLRVQKLDSDGHKFWGEEPIFVDEGLYFRGHFEVESDQNDGAYLWYLTKNDSLLHVVNLDGKGWQSWHREFVIDGSVVEKSHQFPHPSDARPMAVAPDGSGIFILTNGFQRLTKLAPTGEVLWETLVSVRADSVPYLYIDGYTLLADSAGGCIVLWEEVGSFNGLRAQRVDRYGNLGGYTTVQQMVRQDIPEREMSAAVNPNPFNETVSISLSLPAARLVSIKIYHILGREVITLKQERLMAGHYSITWDGTDLWGQQLASGIYFLVVQSDLQTVSNKLILLKEKVMEQILNKVRG